jgi:dihydrodipicolinate synthase/N-acetylneuraminate lyase
MDRNSVDWSGAMPAVTTPFDASGIDETAFSANVDRLIRAGATGIVAGGCTGEFWALTHEERKRLCNLARNAVGRSGTVIVGTGAVTVDETVALTRHAEAAGCDGVLVVPPYFVKLTDDELYQHYSEVSSGTGVPILIYNIPTNAVNALSPGLVSRLADIDHVVAIKESSGDWNNFYATLLAVKDRLRVFCGPSSMFGAPALQLGADGFVDCFPNVWSPGGIELYSATKNRDADRSARLQALGRELTDLFSADGRTLYPSTKAAMDIMGYPGGGAPRAPLRPLGATPRAALEQGLKALGLL